MTTSKTGLLMITIRGRLSNTSHIALDIKTLEQDGTYKFLGVNEEEGIQHATMKDKIRKEYYRRIRLILKNELITLPTDSEPLIT